MLHPFYETEGPFGLPMTDAQARRLEDRIKSLPRDEAFAFRRRDLRSGAETDGRCDVSWITEESPDRIGDVVRAAGMDDSHFALNPLVTLNHDYARPPVGRSLWRRPARAGERVGIQAKTYYPPRPANWQDAVWPPDAAFELLAAGLLGGKSIGFLPLSLREPTPQERPRMKGVRYLVESWMLVEYACCFLPMQPFAVVEQVERSVGAVGRLERWLSEPKTIVQIEKMASDLLTPTREIW